MDDFLMAHGFFAHPFAQKSAEEEEELPAYFVRGTYFIKVLGSPQQTTATLFFAGRGNGKSSMARMINYQLKEAGDKPVLVVNFGREAFDELVEEVGEVGQVSQQLYRSWLLARTQQALNEQRDYLEKFEQVGLLDLPPPTSFRNLSQQLYAQGVAAIYVLVDGIDELPQTAADPEKATNLILPLVSDLILLETAHVAFKFFLPIEIKELLIKNGKVRFDRFVRLNDRWNWELHELSELLQMRLAHFSNNIVHSLGQFSELPDIDVRMCEAARGSPRNLIRLGNYVLEEHSRQDSDLTISEAAWLSALERLEQALKQEGAYKSTAQPPDEVPPVALEKPPMAEKPLETSRENQNRVVKSDLLSVQGLDVYVGENRLEPGPIGLELKVLTALYNHCGKTCSKDDLIEQAYGGVAASDEQLNAVIKRLRRKLKEPSPQYYIKTVWGEGFRLINCIAPKN